MAGYSERPMRFELSMKPMPGPIVFTTTHHGGRKHLNMLLQDYHASILMSNTGEGVLPSPSATGAVQATAHRDTRAQTAPASASRFDHPYVHGGPEADEMKRAVNNKRTPIGNFFQISNPALSSKQPPAHIVNAHSTNPIHNLASKTIDTSGSVTNTLPSKGPSLGAIQFAASLAAKAADPHRFTTSYRLGDRKGGALSAALVNSKRTPTGGFYDQRS